MTQKDNNVNKKPKSKFMALKVIAEILYVIAGIIFALAMINLVINLVNGAVDIVPDFDDPDPTFEGFGFFGEVIGSFRSFVTCIILCVVATILMIIYRNKNRNITFEEKNEDDSPVSKYKTMFKDIVDVVKDKVKDATGSPIEEKKEEKVHIFCAYCGSELDENDKKCPSCGASKKIRKKPNQNV